MSLKILKFLMTQIISLCIFCRDMDDWSFALLSCKVVLKSFLTDSVIYKRDSPSDFAYIIVSGSIQVLFCRATYFPR